MYKNYRILALIPARGGSKGIKNKNIIDLNGRPLISYTIEAAIKSKYVDDVIVTTDSESIARVAQKHGAEVPFMRPKELAADTSKTIDAVIHAVRTLSESGRKYDTLLLLQPTQPLRTCEDIDGAIELFFARKMMGVVSVSLVDDHPLLIRSIDKNGKLTSLLNCTSTCRRQDMSEFYRVNGCIYINSIYELSDQTSFNDNPIGYIMKRSHSIDIDEMKDLYLAEYYIQNKCIDDE